jgi:hypothetical protein
MGHPTLLVTVTRSPRRKHHIESPTWALLVSALKRSRFVRFFFRDRPVLGAEFDFFAIAHSSLIVSLDPWVTDANRPESVTGKVAIWLELAAF